MIININIIIDITVITTVLYYYIFKISIALFDWYHVLETKQKVRIVWLIFATKRTSRVAKSLTDDAEANVGVSKEKFFSQPNCTD